MFPEFRFPVPNWVPGCKKRLYGSRSHGFTASALRGACARPPAPKTPTIYWNTSIGSQEDSHFSQDVQDTVLLHKYNVYTRLSRVFVQLLAY